MLSKSASEGFSIDDASRDTVKSSLGNVTSEGLTAASEPTAIQTLTETKSVNNFVHNADHVLFVEKGVSSSRDVSSTDDSLTDNGSLGTRSLSASGSTGNIRAGRISFNHQDPVSIDTRSKYGRSTLTTDRAGTDLQGSGSGVLALEGTFKVVQNGRNKLVLDVVSDGARSLA